MIKPFADEEGSSLVETAFVLSTLLAFMIGIIFVCQALSAYSYTAEAARLGTRFAIVRGSGCTSFAAACPASATDVQNYIRGIKFPAISPAKVTVTTTWPTTGSACTPSSSPCNNAGNTVQVKVQYANVFKIPFASALDLSVSSTSKMVISQ
jgi:hypothetical protein